MQPINEQGRPAIRKCKVAQGQVCVIASQAMASRRWWTHAGLPLAADHVGYLSLCGWLDARVAYIYRYLIFHLNLGILCKVEIKSVARNLLAEGGGQQLTKNGPRDRVSVEVWGKTPRSRRRNVHEEGTMHPCQVFLRPGWHAHLPIILNTLKCENEKNTQKAKDIEIFASPRKGCHLNWLELS